MMDKCGLTAANRIQVSRNVCITDTHARAFKIQLRPINFHINPKQKYFK